jgi:hypothetical protein
MSTNVRVDLTSYISACHLGADILSEEKSEFLTNKSRLDKSTRRALSVLAGAATTLLKSSLDLALTTLRELASLSGYSSKLSAERCKLS